MTILTIILGSGFALSILFNVILIWYAKTSLSKLDTVYTASETSAEIFSMLDTYGEHLQSVYEMPIFYGDETLSGLLEHTKEMIKYLEKYDEVYSLTQPDLKEQLFAASAELGAEEYDYEETQSSQE